MIITISLLFAIAHNKQLCVCGKIIFYITVCKQYSDGWKLKIIAGNIKNNYYYNIKNNYYNNNSYYDTITIINEYFVTTMVLTA